MKKKSELFEMLTKELKSKAKPKKVLHFGIAGLDLIIPSGIEFSRILELSGFSMSAKSFLAQKLSANFLNQNEDALVLYIDRENACEEKRLLELGIDMERFFIVPPSKCPTIEKCYEIACEFFDKSHEEGIDGLVVIDSIASFGDSKAKLVEDQGRAAKRLHEFFRNISGHIYDNNLLIFSNHKYIAPGFIAKEVKSGGHAPNFWGHVALSLMNVSALKRNNDETYAYVIKAEVSKNRRDEHLFDYTRWVLDFKYGAHPFTGVLDYLAQKGIIQPRNKEHFRTYKQLPVFEYDTGEAKIQLSERNIEKAKEIVEKYKLLEKLEK